MPITFLHKEVTRHQLPLPYLLVEPFIEKHRRRRLFADATVSRHIAWLCRFYCAQAFALAARFITRDPKSLLQLLHGRETDQVEGPGLDDPEKLREDVGALEDAMQKRVIGYTRLYGPPLGRCSSIRNFLGIYDFGIKEGNAAELEMSLQLLHQESVTVFEALEQAKAGAYLGIGIGLYFPHLANAEMFFYHDMEARIDTIPISSQAVHPFNEDVEIATLGHLAYESFRKEAAIANRYGLDEFVRRWSSDKYEEIRHLTDTDRDDIDAAVPRSLSPSELTDHVGNQKGSKPFVTMRKDPSCPIWPDSRADVVDDHKFEGVVHVIGSWRTGGDYSITHDAEESLRQHRDRYDRRVRAQLTAIIIDKRRSDNISPLVTTCLVEAATRGPELTLEARADRLLLYMSRTIDYVGHLFPSTTEKVFLLPVPLDSPQIRSALLAHSESTTWEELVQPVELLRIQGFIEFRRFSRINPFESDLRITYEGIKRITDLPIHKRPRSVLTRHKE